MKDHSSRRFGRTRAARALAAAALRIPPWMISAAANRRSHERAFFKTINAGFGLTVEWRGTISQRPGTLFVMNHISWADIPVMLSLLDADFVARADLRDWPVIGRLAQRLGPVFVERQRKGSTQGQVAAIRERLTSGRSVILCAEGTTSDGSGILPFRTSLFAAADAAIAVQPVILAYLAVDGSALTPQRQREVAWIGDDDLVSGAARLARQKTLARAMFLPPSPKENDRKTLAAHVRQQMLEAYAAATNRSR
ncbi:MAG: hypothetical protein C0511_09075 [Hyphomicrobium sp.]|nr:hypothetical protein [Hyphomicrobium sp.]